MHYIYISIHTHTHAHTQTRAFSHNKNRHVDLSKRTPGIERPGSTRTMLLYLEVSFNVHICMLTDVFSTYFCTWR